MKAFWNIENIDVILLCRFLFTANRDEGIARESFSFKIILRSPWYIDLSFNFSVIFIWCGLLDNDVFPFNSICQ